MTLDSQQALWGALAQIIPVILLAFVLEARLIPTRYRKKYRNSLRFLRTHPELFSKRFRVMATVVYALAAGPVTRLALATAVSVALMVVEVYSLVRIAYPEPLPKWHVVVAIGVVIVGLTVVACYPLLARLMEAIRLRTKDR